MTLLKILFLLLIIIPFALFLLYILDRLMDEMPSKEEMEAEMSPVERRRSRAAARRGRGAQQHRQKAPNRASKRKRRKERKNNRKKQQKETRKH